MDFGLGGNFMIKQPKILAFAGSLREHSYNKRVLQTAAEGAKNAGAEVTYIDLRDYAMPITTRHSRKEVFPKRRKLQKIFSHTTLLISSP